MASPDLLRLGRVSDEHIPVNLESDQPKSAPIPLVLANPRPAWIDRLLVGVVVSQHKDKADPDFPEALKSYVRPYPGVFPHHLKLNSEPIELEPFQVFQLNTHMPVSSMGSDVSFALYVVTDNEDQWYALSFKLGLYYRADGHHFRVDNPVLTRAEPPIRLG